MINPPPYFRPNNPVITPFSDQMASMDFGFATAPVSGTWTTAQLARFYPIYLPEPLTVAKAFWCNGATVGTDSIDLGVYRMTDMATGRCDLIRSTGAVLSAGTVSVVQDVSTWKVAANQAALTAAADSTDGTAFTTASVTLKAGRLYLLTVVNTAASAGAITSITGGPTFSQPVANMTTQFNGTAHRVSVWAAVPAIDYTGTLVINFGATQTGAKWALNEFSGVDTTTTLGVVQAAVGTGNSTTPLATLGAFSSTANATFGANANVADSTTTPGAGFTELSDDATVVTPGQFLQTQWRVDNDTTSDGTITSGQWGAIAIEIKADASPFLIPQVGPGLPNIYMGMAVSGTTATILRVTNVVTNQRIAGYLEKTSTFPLPSNVTPVLASNSGKPLAGFSSRSLLG